MATTTMATMAVLNTKCLTLNTNKTTSPLSSTKPTIPKPISLLSIQNLPKGLTSSSPSPIIAAPALAGAIFATLGSVDPALAAQQLADIAEGSDNRGLALLLPIIPAIGWVLFNILQPALNQINKMRNEKAVIVGAGLSGLTSAGLLFYTPEAQAASEEIAKIAENAGGSDNRGTLLLFVVLPAIGWVLFNILQPALNQLNRMRSQ